MTAELEWELCLSGGIQAASGRFVIRKYEERYNLRRVIVNRGWELLEHGRRVGRFDRQRDAKIEAQRRFS